MKHNLWATHLNAARRNFVFRLAFQRRNPYNLLRMREPLVSVIIPVYNTAEYLFCCLESVLKQTYAHLEIICIDDGSTDESLNIIREYAAKDGRIRVITQENQGIATTRNIGLKAANGEWLTWVDSDDWLETDAYEKVMKVIKPQLDLICFGGKIEGDIDSGTRDKLQKYNNIPFQGHRQMTPDIARDLNVYLWCKFMRREVVVNHAISFPDGRIYEDAAFLYCLYPFINGCHFISDHLYHYRQHSSSIMDETRKRTPRGVDHLHIIRHIWDFYTACSVKSEWREFIRLKFANYYTLAISSTPLECRKEISELASDLAGELGVEVPYLPFLNRRKISHPESHFHSYNGNCESFGIGRFHLFSIAYSRQEKVLYIIGKKLLTIKSAAQPGT